MAALDRIPMLGVITVLVGLAALALVVSPLAVFMLQYYSGGLNVSFALAGSRVEINLFYNITVPLEDFTISISALSSNGTTLDSATSHRDTLRAGDVVTLSLDALKFAQASTLRIVITGKIAGLYSFNVSMETPIGG
jgi:hypothetical protein